MSQRQQLRPNPLQNQDWSISSLPPGPARFAAEYALHGPGSARAQGVVYPPNELAIERTRKSQQRITEEALTKAAAFKVKEETEGLSDAERLEAEKVFQQAEHLQRMTGPSFKRDAESLQRVPGFKRGPDDYIILYGDFSELQVKVNGAIAAGYYPIGSITIDNDTYYQSMVRKEMKGGNGRRKRKTRKVKKNY